VTLVESLVGDLVSSMNPYSDAVPRRVSFGLRVANYRQLRDAVSLLREYGVRSTRTATAWSLTTKWNKLAGTARCAPRRCAVQRTEQLAG